MKYYWILTQTTSLTSSGPYYSNQVIKEHPFSWLKKKTKSAAQDFRVVLFDWKEITQKEYELHSEKI